MVCSLHLRSLRSDSGMCLRRPLSDSALGSLQLSSAVFSCDVMRRVMRRLGNVTMQLGPTYSKMAYGGRPEPTLPRPSHGSGPLEGPKTRQGCHYSIFGRRIPAVLHPYEFPMYRQLFLLGAVLWYFVDVGLDLFVAGTYLEAHLSGRDAHALAYFIATMVFLVVPSALVQLLSWLLYFWSYHLCGNQGPSRVFQRFCHAHHQSGDSVACVALACSDPGTCNADKLIVAAPRDRPTHLPLHPDITPAVGGGVRDHGLSPVMHSSGVGHQTGTEQGSCHSHPRLSPHVVYASADESTSSEQVEGQGARQDGTVRDLLPPVHLPSPLVQLDIERGLARYRPHNSQMISETSSRHGVLESTDGGTSFYPLDCLSRRGFVTVTVLHILQLAFPVRAVRLLWFSTSDPFSYFRYRDISFLRLMEAFLESGPQAILQLYLMQVQEEPVVFYRVITPLSIISSFVGLSLAVADFASAGKDILAFIPISPHPEPSPVTSSDLSYDRMSWTMYFLVIVWNLSSISARGLALSFFAAEYSGYVLLILAVHYVVMVCWMYHQTGQMYQLAAGDAGIQSRICGMCRRYLIEFIAAGFNLFFYFSIYDSDDDPDSRAQVLKRVTAYHILVFVENSVMTLLWFAVVDLALWYSYLGLAAVFVLYGVGVGFMGLYYCLSRSETGGQEGHVWGHFDCHGHVGRENLKRVKRFTSTLNWFFDHNRVTAQLHAQRSLSM